MRTVARMYCAVEVDPASLLAGVAFQEDHAIGVAGVVDDDAISCDDRRPQHPLEFGPRHRVVQPRPNQNNDLVAGDPTALDHP